MTPFPIPRASFRVERLRPPPRGSRAVIDTDANNEIDDQFALVHALLSPEVGVEAVYAAPFRNAHSAPASSAGRLRRCAA